MWHRQWSKPLQCTLKCSEQQVLKASSVPLEGACINWNQWVCYQLGYI